MNGQHRGDGHPYGSDEPTPRPTEQEPFRPRHGSPWPDDERPASEHPYGPGQGGPYEGPARPQPGTESGAAPYGGGADPYAGGAPQGPAQRSPYPPAEPSGRPDPFGPDFRTQGPQNADPYGGAGPYGTGPQGASPYGTGPQNADPYGGASPYGGAPQGGAPYGGAPQGGGPGADPYGSAPRADEGQFSAGALGGGRFGADAPAAPGGGPTAPGGMGGAPTPPGGPGGGPAGPGGAPRHPSEEATAQYQRRPEWQDKPYAPPNASTEALPHVGSQDQRVASAGTPAARPERPAPAPPAAPLDQEQDVAAPTSAFRAFAAGESRDVEEGGYPGYSRIHDHDEIDDGGSSAPMWSLVLGIIGIVAMPLLGLGVIASVAALVTARSAARAKQASGAVTAGRFLGWIGIGLFIVGAIGGIAYAVL